jgi:small-conductance mechanosensitive channel
MPCRVTCMISSVFIIGMIYMTNSMTTSGTVNKYESQLPEHLVEIYNKIVEERTQIYYTGFILGLVLSVLFFVVNKQIFKIHMSNTSFVCFTIMISFLSNYFYYILTPKQNYMLDHIDNLEQSKAWLEMYKSMQFSYHFGLFLGLLGVGTFAYAFRCNK